MFLYKILIIHPKEISTVYYAIDLSGKRIRMELIGEKKKKLTLIFAFLASIFASSASQVNRFSSWNKFTTEPCHTNQEKWKIWCFYTSIWTVPIQHEETIGSICGSVHNSNDIWWWKWKMTQKHEETIQFSYFMEDEISRRKKKETEIHYT